MKYKDVEPYYKIKWWERSIEIVTWAVADLVFGTIESNVKENNNV